jgi:hypothetical protein
MGFGQDPRRMLLLTQRQLNANSIKRESKTMMITSPAPTHTQRPGLRLNKACAAALVLLASSAQAATVSSADLAALRAEARLTGVASVLVHLEASTLERLRKDSKGLRLVSQRKANALLKELGPAALASGRWQNGAGQIGLHVTAAGLDVLRGTAHALSFMPGPRWQNESQASNADGSQDAIEEALRRQGFVDVEVLGQVEGLAVEQLADGKANFQAPAAALEAAQKGMGMLLEDLTGLPLAQARSALGVGESELEVQSPLRTLRVNREQLLRLARQPQVRALRPVGHVDARKTQIDPDALRVAQQQG